MTAGTNFKVGIIGTGGIAHAHAQAFMAAGVDIVGAAEILEDRRRAFADRYDIPYHTSDYRELLRRENIDAVALCLPNALHSTVAVAAMEAGKHVLTEKPMAINAAEAERMVSAQKETQKTLLVGLQRRYAPVTTVAKQYAEEFGRIYFGKCGYLRRSGIPGWGSWFTRREESGGGPCADIGVHVLDQCLYLMGYPKPVSVTASTYAEFGPEGRRKGGWGYRDPSGYFDVEDLAAALISFENGASVIMEASWAMNRPDKRWVEVYGTEGGMEVGDGLQVYSEKFGSPVDASPQVPQQEARLVMVEHFLACCRTGTTPLTSPEQGLTLSRIFDAVYESGADNGRQVIL